MSENNSGAFVPQQDNRGNDQNKEKRQRFDPSKQGERKNNYNRNNRRRRNNGQRQGVYDNKKGENGEVQAEVKNQNRERNNDRQQPREKNNNKFNKREQNQGGEKRNQQTGERKPKNKRAREFGSAEEVAKNVKKVETIDDIRSDNARITKEIYLEIASLKNINLN